MLYASCLFSMTILPFVDGVGMATQTGPAHSCWARVLAIVSQSMQQATLQICQCKTNADVASAMPTNLRVHPDWLIL